MFRYLTPGIIGRVLVFGAFFWFSRSSRGRFVPAQPNDAVPQE